MKTLLVITLVQFISIFSLAFVLPIDSVLKKNIGLNGKQIISLEQDVVFSDGVEELIVQEVWYIEGDKNLKLVATGIGELKDQFKIVAIYNNKNRTIFNGKNRITEPSGKEFFEKYLSIRSLEAYKNLLNEAQIQNNIRMSRSNGTIAFSIGEPSTMQAMKPQIWVEQDTFYLSKIRFLSQAEVSFDNYSEVVANKLYYPKTKKIDWLGKTAIIKVKSINPKSKAQFSTFYPQNLDIPSEISIQNKTALSLVVEDFYKRFR